MNKLNIIHYRAIKLFYIYVYLYEVYCSYYKSLEQAYILDSLLLIDTIESNAKDHKIFKDETKINKENKPISNIKKLNKVEIRLNDLKTSHYDPVKGRFLQIDPLGYKDSLNLYQGMNMNPYNFSDPFGEAIINLFVGFKFKKQDQMCRLIKKNATSTTPTIFNGGECFTHPDWEGLKEIAAKNGHSLNIMYKSVKIVSSGNKIRNRFNRGSFRHSLQNESFQDVSISQDDEVWTFFLGHTSTRSGIAIGLKFNEFTLSGSQKINNNKYVGAFSCSSSKVASSLFPTSDVFSIEDHPADGSTVGNGTSLDQKLEWSLYYLLKYLIINKNPKMDKALEAANDGYHDVIPYREDRKDKVIVK